MSRQKARVPYAFKPLHAKMPLRWRPLSFHQRSILRELWAHSDNGFLESTFRYLVRDYLDAHTKADRRNLTVGVQQLFAKGFLTEDERGVTVHTDERPNVPIQGDRETASYGVGWAADRPHGYPTDTPRMSHGCPTDSPEVPSWVNPTQAKPAKSLDSDLTEERDLDLDQESETRARACVREAKEPERVIAFRRPLPEPPPDLPAPEPCLEARKRALADRICAYLREAGKRASGATPKPSTIHAQELAAWCLTDEARADWRLDSVELAKRVCDGLVASERARKAGYPLAWAAKNPLEFLGTTPGAPKPQTGAEAAALAERERQARVEAESLSAAENVAEARAVLAALRGGFGIGGVQPAAAACPPTAASTLRGPVKAAPPLDSLASLVARTLQQTAVGQ